MTEFKYTQKMDGDLLDLGFEGSIDEDSAFPAVDAASVRRIRIDLQGIKSINSVGIREWLDWIRPLNDKVEITLDRCPKAMVFQFNMVEGFLPSRATVTSFYVPFFCEKCDREENVLFTVGKDVVASGGAVQINAAPKVTQCPDGEGDCEMEMDVTESKYFQFLKR